MFHCAHVHGKVDMRQAIAESCNVYFAHLAEAVGMDRLARMANEFGLGAKTGIGVNPEAAGRIPTRAWYALRYKGQFRLGFTINASIGQGAASVTPLQLALAYAALGNGGTVYMPQLVRAVETSDGAIVTDFPPRVRHKANVTPEDLARVDDALFAVVNDPKGNCYPVRDATLDVAGKSGTAQTGYIAAKDVDAKTAAYNSQNHAWFVAFSPAKSPDIAVVVLIEHGGSGPTVAAPLAMQMVRDYERLMAARAGHPLPKPIAASKVGPSIPPSGAP
jgi:penicillin-binding protein 2